MLSARELPPWAALAGRIVGLGLVLAALFAAGRFSGLTGLSIDELRRWLEAGSAAYAGSPPASAAARMVVSAWRRMTPLKGPTTVHYSESLLREFGSVE